jgi:glycosyltransferase involved in cell wall biosynthesis/GT2 family glycosyltransferase
MSRVCVGVHAHEDPARLALTLDTLRANTPPHDVLLLGDGPDAATRAAIAAAGLPSSSTREARGPAACFNRLARESDADVLVLLESGSLVAPRWLEHLLTGLARPGVGLAGPSTNNAWNEQCVLPGSRPDALPDSAARLEERFRERVRTLEPLLSLADFCYAVRREVVDALGEADEGYGLGPCWEMDYNARAARAGFTGVWVGAAFVHRLPFTARRQREESARFDDSRRRYQDSFCALRLRGTRWGYEAGCRGLACEHFAPPDLIRLELRSQPKAPRVAEPPRPLVTCVMPTRNRRELALNAVRLWQAQDCTSELIVVDDGTDGLEAALPRDPRIVYVRAPAGESIGAKRNRACERARGEVVVQWDDDDWYGAGRVSAQVEPILAGRADVTGLRCETVLDLERWEWWTCDPALHARLFVGDVHGGTLAFRRELWLRGSRYPDRSLAEDAGLLSDALRRGARLVRLDGRGLFAYVRHGTNSWRQFTPGAQGWRRIPEPALPAADRTFLAARARADVGPLVTCLMPTADRRSFVARAIDCFLRQDYAARELLVLDDGADRVGDLVPDDPRIRYVELPERLVLGTKRNRGCELAAGELIAHWDDDDWQAPHRLSYQIGELARTGADVCGPARLLYAAPEERRAWLYAYPQARQRWAAGNALLYRRSLWERNRFPDVPVGEDTRFVWSSAARKLAVHDDHRFVVGLVHDRNTSPKDVGGAWWTPVDWAEVETVTGGAL